MKILAIILLVISLLFFLFQTLQTYRFLVPHELAPQAHCPSPFGCVRISHMVPELPFPLWLPPIVLVLWIFELILYLKGQYRKAVYLGLLIVIQVFVFNIVRNLLPGGFGNVP